MHRLIVRVLPALSLLFAAGLARATVLTPVSKAERAAVRAAIKADARRHLASLPYKFERPSISVPTSSMQRTATGGIKASAEIRSLGFMGIPGGPKVRIVQQTADYLKQPGSAPVNTTGWQQIFYAQPAGNP